ncbi:DMT family transporter [Acidisphaera sp. L21]|uniref:DMT family transporter n=1 Tax=Acidisphaera sp. L21 TaxID=1641851 RepID=UPI00131D46AC|nr:DMT family transporter [Acidisphaera sp. L21]
MRRQAPTLAPAADAPNLLAQATPLLFVVIWATGFVVARLVAPHIEPLTFLTFRFTLTAIAFAALCTATRAKWSATWQGWAFALGTGVLMQGIYLGGIFWATHRGLPASVAALITGLQPLATALLAFPLLGEQVSRRRWLGIVTGFVGAILVIAPTLAQGAASRLGLGPILMCLASMLAITAATLVQKRLPATTDLRTHACGQFIGGTAFVAPLAWFTERGVFDNDWQLWVGLAWGVLALSVGASLLLLTPIRRRAVSGVASLFYLVPPVVALMALVLFGDELGTVQIVGMVVAAIGVSVASRG